MMIHGGGPGGGGGDDPNRWQPIKEIGHYVDLYAADVWVYILEFLDGKDMVTLRLTSKGRKSLVDELFRRDPEFVERLHRVRAGPQLDQFRAALNSQPMRVELVNRAARSAGQMQFIMEHIARLPGSRVRVVRAEGGGPFRRLMQDSAAFQQGQRMALAELQAFHPAPANPLVYIFLVLLVVFFVFLYFFLR